MFTGIIEEVGNVRESSEGRLVFDCRKVLEGTTTVEEVLAATQEDVIVE